MLKSSSMLLNVRLSFYGVAILHLIFAAIMILPIDMSKDDDPRVSIYIRIRWKLLTCWFNLMMLAYFPICFYCDWKEKRGEWGEMHVRRLRKIRDNLMTSIIFPTTMYCDFSFWIMWAKDPALIAPVAIFNYLPFWAQHSLHTVSGIMVLIDILILPRRRPANIIPGIALMLTFCALYCSVVASSHLNGEPVYSIFEKLSYFELFLFVVVSITKYFFFHLLQWHIIELMWGKSFRNDYKNNTQSKLQQH